MSLFTFLIMVKKITESSNLSNGSVRFGFFPSLKIDAVQHFYIDLLLLTVIDLNCALQ